MSLSSDLEVKWETYVFEQADVQAFSEKFYFFDVIEASETEVSRLLFDREINFFQCLIVRAHRQLTTSCVQYDYTVQVSYYRTKSEDPTGANWSAVRDALEQVFDTAYNVLESNMQGTVDYWEPQEGPPSIDSISIGDESVWRGIYIFNATKQISI